MAHAAAAELAVNVQVATSREGRGYSRPFYFMKNLAIILTVLVAGAGNAFAQECDKLKPEECKEILTPTIPTSKEAPVK